MKVGGQILWNVTPVCETSQIYYLMGRETPYERRFGQPFKGTIIPLGSLVEYHPYNCEGSVKNPSFWQRKSCLDCSPDTLLYTGGIWKGDVLIADLEELETDGRIGNLLEKTRCKRGDNSQTRRIYFSNRRWTNQNLWSRSGPENIHFGTASTNSWRKSHWFSWRIRRVSSTTSWIRTTTQKFLKSRLKNKR